MVTTSRCAGCGAWSAVRSGASVRVADVRQPAGGVMATHAHETPRLIVVLRGRYEERCGSRRRDCNAATVVFRPAGQPHADAFEYEDVRYVTVALPADSVEAGDARRRRRFASAFELRSEVLLALGARLAAEVASPDAAAPIVLEGLALELLARIELPDGVRAERSPRWIRLAELLP